MNGATSPTPDSPGRRRTRHRVMVVFVLLAIVAFGVLVAVWTRFAYLGPSIERDFVTEAKARIAAIPEDQRAMPLIERACANEKQIDWSQPEFESAAIGQVRPDSPVWSHLVNYVDINAASLADAREASKRSWLGAPVTIAEETLAQHAPPMLTDVLLPHISKCRKVACLLAQAAIVKCDRGDLAEACEDVSVALRLAKLMAQGGSSIEQLVAINTFFVVCDLVTRDVLPKAGQMSEQQRDAIRQELREFSLQDGKPISFSFDDQRNAFLDMVQRVYTDDGSGDGRLLIVECDPFTKNVIVQVFGLATRIRPTSGFWQFPMAMWCATRSETVAAYDAIIREAEIEIETPPYTWAAMDTRADYTARVLRTSREQKRHPIVMLNDYGALYAATLSRVWDARQQQAAVDVGFAIEQFRGREGRAPETLRELVPRDLDAVPTDMFDGKPLKYVVRGGEPLLYSVGPDGVDDGATDSYSCGWSDGSLSKDFVLYPHVAKPPEPENTDPNAK